jgi:O-antigen/teichoic acid export membrane protein
MKKDMVVTFLTEFCVLVSALLAYKLVAHLFGKTLFEEYALIRRTVSLIQPALLLGLGVGIPRYVSFALKSEDPRAANSYFLTGLVLVMPFTAVVAIGLILFRRFFAYLFFGDMAYAGFLPPMSLMLIGLVLHAAVYSFYRGRLQMGRANLLQALNLAVVPLAALCLARRLSGFLILMGAAWSGVAFVFLVEALKAIPLTLRGTKLRAKTLLGYGLQRVPGDFGLAALLALPATFTAHAAGIEKAGQVAFAISLLNMAGSAFAPIGLILLPKASRLIAEKREDELRRLARRILGATVALTVLGVAVFEVWARQIVELYLGRGFSDFVGVARMMMAGCLAYSVYVSMRSLIDAYHFKAVNTLNIFVALVVFCVLSFGASVAAKNPLWIVVSFVLALYVLGGLTFRVTHKILNKERFVYQSR